MSHTGSLLTHVLLHVLLSYMHMCMHMRMHMHMHMCMHMYMYVPGLGCRLRAHGLRPHPTALPCRAHRSTVNQPNVPSLAARCPCGHPALQKHHPLAQGGPLGPRGDERRCPSPRDGRGEAATVCWRLPTSPIPPPLVMQASSVATYTRHSTWATPRAGCCSCSSGWRAARPRSLPA